MERVGLDARWGAPATPTPAPEAPAHGVMPSALSSLGGLLGLAAPALAVPGEMIGSAANELRSSVPKLAEMARHGGGLFGPMGSTGVADAMMAPAAHMAEDLAGNTVLNKAPGVIGAGLSKAGTALAQGAAKAPSIMTRAAVGPLLHYLGVPEGPAAAAEIASVAGPAIAKVAGPRMAAMGEAMPSTSLGALRRVGQALKPGLAETAADAEPSVVSGLKLSPDALERNVKATNLRDVEGFSHRMAGKLSDIPGAGESTAVDVPMGEHNITDEMVANARADNPSASGLRQAAAPPDLMELATQPKGPVAPGTPWTGENGEVIGHTTDTGGSTGLQMLDEPPPLDSRISGVPPPDTALTPQQISDADALARLKRAAGPGVADMQRAGQLPMDNHMMRMNTWTPKW